MGDPTPRELPLDRQLVAALASTLFHAAAYFTANHWPIGTPVELALGPVDRDTPFIPATVFVYLSDYFLVFFAFMSLKKRENVVRFLWVFMTCVVVASAIHAVFPTAYPRHAFPVPDDTDALSKLALKILRFFDSPNSCLPSLHVGAATASGLLVWRERKLASIAFVGWSLAVAGSTLTTKQHYALDVITGWLLAGLVLIAVDFALSRRRPTPPPAN